MALRDRRNERAKVDPSAAQKWAQEQTGKAYSNATEYVVDQIKNSPVGVGFRTAKAAWNPIVGRVLSDAESTRSTINSMTPPTIQDPQLRTTPFQPPTQDNTQLPPEPQVGRASTQPTQTGLRAAAGEQIYTAQDFDPVRWDNMRGMESASTDQNTFRSDGRYTFNDTGLQVEFDPSTSQEERRAFMRQPGRPGTQRIAGLRQPGEMSEREKYFARNQARRGGSAGVSLAEGVGIDGFVPVGLNSGFSREGRNARNQTRMINALRENADRELERETAQLQAKTPIIVAGLRESGATARQLGVNAINREGNLLDYDIDQQNAQTLGGLRGSSIALNQAKTAEVGPNAEANRNLANAKADAAGLIKLPVRRDIDGSVTRTDVYRAGEGDNLKSLTVPVPRTMEGFITSQISADPELSAAWRKLPAEEQQQMYQEWLLEQRRQDEEEGE